MGAVANMARPETNIVSPIEHPNAGQISKDRHSVLVQFDVKGKDTDAHNKIAPMLARVAGVQQANPDFTIEEFGGWSKVDTEFFDDASGKVTEILRQQGASPE